jgi:uncharacterized damage-inducible protein DinB
MSELKRILLGHMDYSAWATRQLLAACSGVEPQQLECELGSSHSSILGTFRHIYDGERVWLDRLNDDGEWRLPPGPAPEYSFAFLIEAWPKLWKGYRECLERASESDFSHEFVTLLPNDTFLRGPRWQIVLHVVNHSSLHRGQIISMLRSVGARPANADLMSYYLTL